MFVKGYRTGSHSFVIPRVIRDARFHGQGDADRAVNPTVLVIVEPEAERGPVVLPLPAEAVREPGEAADIGAR